MKDKNFLIENQIDVNASLELFGDMDTYNETLGDFLDTIQEKLDNILEFKEKSDMLNYSILVHSLKSDSKYLGFTKLAELSLNHEMEGKANNVDYVYNKYDELVAEADRIVNIVKEYLGKTDLVVEVIKPKVNDKKIIVADDSHLIRNLIMRMFDDEYEVVLAKDGREALQLIHNDDSVYGMLLDLNMPVVDGFAVLEYLKVNGYFVKLPVAIITGDDTKETVAKAFTYPIVDVLNKPFNERDIKRVLNSMVNFH